jgi:hypothetical protein
MPVAGFAEIWTVIIEEPAIFFPMGFPSMTAIEMPLG